jgi:hypothetical protein
MSKTWTIGPALLTIRRYEVSDAVYLDEVILSDQNEKVRAKWTIDLETADKAEIFFESLTLPLDPVGLEARILAERQGKPDMFLGRIPAEVTEVPE